LPRTGAASAVPSNLLFIFNALWRRSVFWPSAEMPAAGKICRVGEPILQAPAAVVSLPSAL